MRSNIILLRRMLQAQAEKVESFTDINCYILLQPKSGLDFELF